MRYDFFKRDIAGNANIQRIDVLGGGVGRFLQGGEESGKALS